jgi:hypothetical protein
MSSIQKAVTMVQSIFRSLKNKEDQTTFMDAITEYYLQLEETPRMVITELKSSKIIREEPVKVEAVKIEPVKTVAVKVEPVKAVAVKIEPVKAVAVKVEPVKVEPVTAKPAAAKPATAEPVKVENYKTAVLSTKTVETKNIEPFLWSDSPGDATLSASTDHVLVAKSLFEIQEPLTPLKNLLKGKVYRTCILHSISDLHAKIFPKTRDDGFSEFLAEMTDEEFNLLFLNGCDSTAFQDELTRLVPLFFTKNVEAKSVKCMNFFTNHAGISILRGDYDSSKMMIPSLREIFKIPTGSEVPHSLLREIAFAHAVQTDIVNQMIKILENVQTEYNFTLVKHAGAPYTPFSLSFKNKETAYSFAGAISREKGQYA